VRGHSTAIKDRHTWSCSEGSWHTLCKSCQAVQPADRQLTKPVATELPIAHHTCSVAVAMQSWSTTPPYWCVCDLQALSCIHHPMDRPTSINS